MTDMEIETFLTVLRSGSMTAAAQALYITQPTLSARLQTLEDEVGTPLFVRGKGLRRLELTEAGTRFLPLAQRWRKLTDEMHGIAAAEARTSVPAHRIDFVYEDDAGLVLLCHIKEVPYPRSADADIHFNEV